MKKVLIFLTSIMMSFIFFLTSIKADEIIIDGGSYNSTGLLYDVKIDERYWDVSWNNKGKIYSELWDKLICETDIHIGKAIYKEKIYNCYYMQYIICCNVKPKVVEYSKKYGFIDAKWTEYPYLQELRLNVNVNDDKVEILKTNPKFLASDTQYSVGGSVGIQGGSGGVSLSAGFDASVTYTSKALDITNLTDSDSKKIDISIKLNEIGSVDYTRYKYMQQENMHYFMYSVLSPTKYFKQKVSVENEVRALDSIANPNSTIKTDLWTGE